MSTDRPWLQHYDKGVPHRLDYPQICVHDLLSEQSKRAPHKKALIVGERSITYGKLEQYVNNLAGGLILNGVTKGDVVGICLPNSIEFVVAFFAVLKAGAIVAAMNPGFPGRELLFQVKTSKARVIITNTSKMSDFQGSYLRTQRLKFILVGEKNTGTDYALNYGELINQLGEDVPLNEILPSDPAVVQFSGGTTGVPKAALGSHRNLIANVTQFRHWLINLEDGNETFLIAIPLYHVYGLVLGLILGIATGATLVFTEKAGNIDELLSAICKYPVSYFPAVPTLFNMISQHPGVKAREYKLASIKSCISGSAPLLESVRIAFEEYTGGYLVEGYGLSEAPTATHCNPIIGEKRNGSIGLPLPDVDCRITYLGDDDQQVGSGEEGELWVRGPQIMLGYLHNKEETKNTIKDGWLRTGDMAHMDKDGYFYLSGRIKDLIKVHGMQVWPNEVEVVISRHPAIVECCVAGVPDTASGERVKAWVVLKPGQTLSLEELRAFSHPYLAGYKIPSDLDIREFIPRTPVGKLLRRVLVEEEKNR